MVQDKELRQYSCNSVSYDFLFAIEKTLFTVLLMHWQSLLDVLVWVGLNVDGIAVPRSLSEAPIDRWLRGGSNTALGGSADQHCGGL